MRRLPRSLTTRPEFAWLGAEALPGGLVRSSDEIESAVGAKWQEAQASREDVSLLGLRSLTRRLTGDMQRLN